MKENSGAHEAKAREFWIIDETPYSTWVSSKPLYSADTKEEIHVIEYSAFAESQARCERYKVALEKIIYREHGVGSSAEVAREALDSSKGETE